MIPFVSEAHAAVNAQAVGAVLNPIISNIVTPIVELMFAFAALVFAYGVLQMVIHADDPDARSKGKMSILGGVIGMVIMMSAWGIIYLVANTVGQFR